MTLRLLPLLAFALLPAVVAAPVPRDVARAEFGANGIVTRAELEKVKFDSQAVKPGERGGDIKEAEDKVDEVRRKPTQPRPKNPYDVAVHMPWKLFREGDPIPAYFILRNNRGFPRALDARLSLSGPEPTLWNSCDIRVRDAKTGKPVEAIKLAGWSCGRGGLVDVPADGYYCVKGDLGGLPPGDYEVDWRYASLRSAPVAFTVQKGDGKPVPAAKRRTYHFFHIKEERDDDDDSPRGRPPIRWRECGLEFMNAEEMESALATGGEFLVPDVHAIPKADKLVEAWVEWKTYRDGDRIAVTLRAVPSHKQVTFEDVPHLYLQIELPAGVQLAQPVAAMEKLEKKLISSEIVTPLTIEARLPAHWRDNVGVSGPTRVAVIVTAKEVELPRGSRDLQKKLSDLRKPPGPDEPPEWSGIVRTEFTELRFPPKPLAFTPER